jgi:hypothetical protein
VGTVWAEQRLRIPQSERLEGDAMSGMSSDDYVGLPEDEATVQAYNNGFDVVRIISRDGNYFPVTRDYREDRINFNIEETLVVQASVG